MPARADRVAQLKRASVRLKTGAKFQGRRDSSEAGTTAYSSNNAV